MASLAVVVVLIVVTLRFGLPLLQKFQRNAGTPRRIQVIEITPLDRSTRLALVEVENREYFLALTADRVARLDSWPKETLQSEETPS